MITDNERLVFNIVRELRRAKDKYERLVRDSMATNNELTTDEACERGYLRGYIVANDSMLYRFASIPENCL